MGMFDFVKSAGEKIFGKSDETKKKEAAMEAAARKQAEEVRRLKMARQLESHVAAMGLEVEDANFSYLGGTVTARGKVATDRDFGMGYFFVVIIEGEGCSTSIRIRPI